MAKITKPNPLKYFNDEKAKRINNLTKAQDGMNYTREYTSNMFDTDQSFLNRAKDAPKKNIVEKVKEKISNYKENKANKKAEEDRPRSRAEAYLVSIPETYKAVSDTSSTKKVNTTTKKVEPKGPKGVIPGTSTNKSTYTDKDSKPVYTDTSRPNEYFTMTKTKAGQDSLAPYNAQMGLYRASKKMGGSTKSNKLKKK